MKPLAFNPPRMYVLKDVWDHPQAARRAARMAEAWPGIDVRTFDYEDVADMVVEEGWDHFPRMGQLAEVPPPIPVFGMFRWDHDEVARTTRRMVEAYKGNGSKIYYDLVAGGDAFSFFCSDQREVRPNPQHVCRPQWRLRQGIGCPHQCAYCSLGGYLVSHLNTEDYIEHLAKLLHHNPWQKTWLYDDAMDVPTMEPQLDTLGPLMRFFESTGDRYLILHTKTDRPDGMLAAGAPHNTIVAWSLSGHTQSRQIEPQAGTSEMRIVGSARMPGGGHDCTLQVQADRAGPKLARRSRRRD